MWLELVPWFTHGRPLIQVDIGGHPPIPPIPRARKTVFHLGSFSTVFRVPNFWGRFEALNDVFWGFGAQVTAKGTNLGPVENRSSRLDLSNGVSSAPNRDRMQKLRPREVDVSTTPIGARKPFGFSSSGVRVLDFTYVKKAFGASL
jgi:hypothetical protein